MSTHVESGPHVGPVASLLLAKLAENWWLLLLRGLAAIAFGVIAFFWPGITLVALTYLFGIYAIVDGLFAIWAAFNASGDAGPRWWLGLSGVVSIVAGVLAFAYTGMTALVLLMFIAAWAIVIGLLQLYAAIQLRKIINNEWWLILSGLLSIAFGAVMIAWPGTGALAVIWTIAWFAVFFGCMFVGLAFELKKFKRT
ncbi:MAG: HdeD family acid-resistance protein [Xanthobacteraceae bacterium]